MKRQENRDSLCFSIDLWLRRVVKRRGAELTGQIKDEKLYTVMARNILYRRTGLIYGRYLRLDSRIFPYDYDQKSTKYTNFGPLLAVYAVEKVHGTSGPLLVVTMSKKCPPL